MLVQADIANVEWSSAPPPDLPFCAVVSHLDEATGEMVTGDLYGPRTLTSETGAYLGFGWVFVPMRET